MLRQRSFKSTGDASYSVSLPFLDSKGNNGSGSVTLAEERWNVEKKRRELDAELESYYNCQMELCVAIEAAINKKTTDLYNEIYYQLKWSNPPVPLVHRNLFLEFCKHILGPNYSSKFVGEEVLHSFNKKSVGGVLEKIVKTTVRKCKSLQALVKKKFDRINGIQARLVLKTGAMTIKRDAQIRWLMEHNEKNHITTTTNKRDKFFTIWYFARHSMLREMQILLASERTKAYKAGRSLDEFVNQPDPDFGLTALHYAAKTVSLDMIKLLLENDADAMRKAPDGRTALHYAAAYSTRDVLLCLLGAGCPHNEPDNYGCIALDLSRQNNNKKTLSTLQNWTTLTSDPATSSHALALSTNRFDSASYATGERPGDGLGQRQRSNDLHLWEDSGDFVGAASIGAAEVSHISASSPLPFVPSASSTALRPLPPLSPHRDSQISALVQPQRGSEQHVSSRTDASDWRGVANAREAWPEAYLPTEEQILKRVSPRLKLVTKRLENCSKLSQRNHFVEQVDERDCSLLLLDVADQSRALSIREGYGNSGRSDSDVFHDTGGAFSLPADTHNLTIAARDQGWGNTHQMERSNSSEMSPRGDVRFKSTTDFTRSLLSKECGAAHCLPYSADIQVTTNRLWRSDRKALKNMIESAYSVPSMRDGSYTGDVNYLVSERKSISYGKQIPERGGETCETGHGAEPLQAQPLNIVFGRSLIDDDQVLIAFDREINDCLMEIRLCGKHYGMCVEERLLEEGFRSLRRRWIVVKTLASLYNTREFLVDEQRVGRALRERDERLSMTSEDDVVRFDHTYEQKEFAAHAAEVRRRLSIRSTNIDQIVEQNELQNGGERKQDIDGDHEQEAPPRSISGAMADQLELLRPVAMFLEQHDVVRLEDSLTQGLLENRSESLTLGGYEDDGSETESETAETIVDLEKIANYYWRQNRVFFLKDGELVESASVAMQENVRKASSPSSAKYGENWQQKRSREQFNSAPDASGVLFERDKEREKKERLDEDRDRDDRSTASLKSFAVRASKDEFGNPIVQRVSVHEQLAQYTRRMTMAAAADTGSVKLEGEGKHGGAGIRTNDDVNVADTNSVCVSVLSDDRSKLSGIGDKEKKADQCDVSIAGKDVLANVPRHVNATNQLPPVLQDAGASSAYYNSAAAKFNWNYMVKLGLELVDVYKTTNQHGMGVIILDECSQWDGTDTSVKIEILGLKCEILLGLYQQLREKELNDSRDVALNTLALKGPPTTVASRVIDPSIVVPSARKADWSRRLCSLSAWVRFCYESASTASVSFPAASNIAQCHGAMQSAEDGCKSPHIWIEETGADGLMRIRSGDDLQMNAPLSAPSMSAVAAAGGQKGLNSVEEMTAVHPPSALPSDPTAPIMEKVCMARGEGSLLERGREERVGEGKGEEEEVKEVGDLVEGLRPLEIDVNPHFNSSVALTVNAAAYDPSASFAEFHSANLMELNSSSFAMRAPLSPSIRDRKEVSILSKGVRSPFRKRRDQSIFRNSSYDQVSAAGTFATAPDAAETESTISELREYGDFVLAHCKYSAEMAITLHTQMYALYLVEPQSKAVLLEHLGKVNEWRDDAEGATMAMSEAEVTAIRALGGHSKLAIRLMLEVLRLHIKYNLGKEHRDLSYVSQKASEINRSIYEFSCAASTAEDLHLADTFTKKCAELLALSTVHADNRAHGIDGVGAFRQSLPDLDAFGNPRKPKKKRGGKKRFG